MYVTVVRPLFGGAAMAVALGAGTTLGAAGADAVGASGLVARLVPAALVSLLGLGLVRLLLRRDRRGWAWLGLGGPGQRRDAVRALVVGVAVTGGAGALVLAAGTAAGMLRWSRLDVGTLLGFLATNALVAVLLEALPEEATLRGYAWGSLRERCGATVSALGTTAVFLLVPGASTVVAHGVGRVLGEEPDPVRLTPAGQHPVDYLILLTVFGLTLVAARTALAEAPLWAGIGTHLTFLTTNRIALEGEERDAGWWAEQTSPDAVLLVPAYLMLACAAFAVVRRASRRRARGDNAAAGRTIRACRA